MRAPAIQTLQFQVPAGQRRERASRRREQLSEVHPPRVARTLALAHRLAEEISQDVYEDYADVARQHGLSRARLTQVMNLLLLAPDIQEEVLGLEVAPGREPVVSRSGSAISVGC